MDFSLTPDQQTIRDAIARVCARFGDDYWLGKDCSGGFLVLDGVYRTTERWGLVLVAAWQCRAL